MRRSILVLVAAFLGSLLPVGAVMINAAPGAVAPQVVAKVGDRSFSGKVQAMAEGFVRLRDDRLGDIKVVINPRTSISNSSHGATSQAIKTGTRLHGYGSFRAGNYYAKVISID